MSSSQVKLLIEPNPKAPAPSSFIQGYPGIPPSPTRAPAHIAGVVHVRAPPKGIQAAWLRIELRKNETIPPGDHWAELIGRGPIDLWTAPGVDQRVAHATATRVARGKMEPAEEPQDWETLKDSTFAFAIPVPEGLPPSARIDKQSAITYDLVASLCIQTKKGLLKKEFHSNVIQATQLVVIEKHELHSMHPIYHISDEHAASTAPSPPNEPTSIVSAKVFRNQTCYGPGDTVSVRIIVSSERISPVKLRNISFAVRETITFRGGSGGTTRSGAPTAASAAAGGPPGSESSAEANVVVPAEAGVQRTEIICSKSKSISKKMYKGDTLMFDLAAPIPKTHNLMSIATAKHIGVSYTMRIVVDLGGGDKATATSVPLNAAKENAGTIVMDHLPMTITNFLRSVSEDIVRAIGHVDGLSVGVGGAAGLLRGGSDEPPSMVAAVRQPNRATTYDLRPQPYPQHQADGAVTYGGQDFAGGHPGMMRRSRSIDGSSNSLGNLPTSATTPTSANALRRSDTIFSQRTTSTNLSGPGLAGRGVPGRLFDWAGNTGGGEDYVRPSASVSGPGSIYHGRTSHRQQGTSTAGFESTSGAMPRVGHLMHDDVESTDGSGQGGRALNQAELAALFHHTDRADSAAEMLGLDPTLFVNDLSSYSGFRAGQKLRAHQHVQAHERNPMLSQFAGNPDSIAPSAPASVYSGGSGVTRPPTVAGAPSVGGGPLASNERFRAGAMHPRVMSAVEQQTERERVLREQAARQNQVSASQAQQRTPSPATHQRHTSTPVIRGPGPALHPGYQSNRMSSTAGPSASETTAPPNAANQSPSPGPSSNLVARDFASAEAEKRMLFERARKEAEQYQAGYAQGAQFPPHEAGPTERPAAANTSRAQVSQQVPEAQAPRPMSMMELGSGARPASTSSPLLAAVTEQRDASPSPSPSKPGQGLPMPPSIHASAYSSAETEKEQMRRFYEARDAVERYQAGAEGSLDGRGPAASSHAGASGTGAASTSFQASGWQATSQASQAGGSSLQRQKTAFFEPYETAPVPSYARMVDEEQQQQAPQNASVHPLTSALHNTRITEASHVDEPPQQPKLDLKGKGVVLSHPPSSAPASGMGPQPAFATSGNTLPIAPILAHSQAQSRPPASSHQLPSSSVAQSQSQPLQAPPPPPPPSFSPAPSSIMPSAPSEKEQMRLYYAARDMQAEAESAAAAAPSASASASGSALASGSGGHNGLGGPAGGAHLTKVVSPKPAYAPGFDGRGEGGAGGPPPPPPVGPTQAASTAPTASQATQPPSIQQAPPPPAPFSSVVGGSSSLASSQQPQGMTGSRPPPLPASLLGIAQPSTSFPPASLAQNQNQNQNQVQQNGYYGVPAFAPPRLPPSSTAAIANASAPASASAPPPPPPPTMPRRAFQDENYTEEGPSTLAVPPPRPPKATSATGTTVPIPSAT